MKLSEEKTLKDITKSAREKIIIIILRIDTKFIERDLIHELNFLSP